MEGTVMTPRDAAALALLAAACASDPPPADPPPATTVPGAPAADSLILTLGGGAEVWFTGSRTGRDRFAVACVERVLEIRDGSGRRTVPLLYVRQAPVAIDDTLFRATLSRDCSPAGDYRVNANDGQPNRELR
jgi:hypothetical protein